MKLDLIKGISKISSFGVILFLCGLNLCVMHYGAYLSDVVDNIEFTTIIDNLFGVTIDVIILFMFAYFLTWKHVKLSLCITFFITWCWSFSNLIYVRFFNHYITLSAVEEFSSLFDSQIAKCVLESLQLSDVIFIFSLFLFVLFVKNIQQINSLINKLILILILVIGIDASAYILYCCHKPEYRYVSFLTSRYKHRQFSINLHLCDFNYASFSRGSIRSILYDLYLVAYGNIIITDEQKEIIEKISYASMNSISSEEEKQTTTNLIFILVESYMSFVSDMKVNGYEITPFLNSLKNDSTVYFNCMMNDNVTIGESSDGQFVYMTGILPLRSSITVSKAKNIILPGLPKVIGYESRMIIPTAYSMWKQDEMCRQYGFDKLYGKDDYKGLYDTNLNDEQVFSLAMEKDYSSKQPFFSIILTMSMHQPYTKQIDSTFLINDSTISAELSCYLNACHYTDKQIAKYFNHLKREGLYDNSLIVIASDHSVHNTDFGGVCKQLPFYIINSHILPSEMWQGECNQLDVYTTLLDLFNCDSDWGGLGHSLTSPNYKNTVIKQTWDASEWIIMSDYFLKKEKNDN